MILDNALINLEKEYDKFYWQGRRVATIKKLIAYE